MSRIQKDANYTRQWLAVRKTRLKKTGMTAFFEMFDKLYREYDAEKFIRDVSGGSNWRNDEARMRDGFVDNNNRFLTLFRAHERDWSADEARVLKEFGRALKAEIEFWEKRPIQRSVEAQEREAQASFPGGEPAKALSRSVDEAGKLATALRLAQQVSTDAGQQAKSALSEALDADAYKRFLATFKQANDRLMTAIEAADKGAVTLAARLSKVERPDPEARGTHEMLKRLVSASTSSLGEAQQRHEEWEAAVRRFESSWSKLKSEVIDRLSGLKTQIDRARRSLDSMGGARETMGFVRGDHFDTAAVRRFRQLESELPQLGQQVRSLTSALSAFELALQRAFADGWGCVLGADSPVVSKAQAELPKLRRDVQRLAAELEDQRRFVSTWKSEIPASA